MTDVSTTVAISSILVCWKCQISFTRFWWENQWGKHCVGISEDLYHRWSNWSFADTSNWFQILITAGLWAVEHTNAISHLSITTPWLLILSSRLSFCPSVDEPVRDSESSSGVPAQRRCVRSERPDASDQKMKFHFHQSRQSSKVCHGEWRRLAANK